MIARLHGTILEKTPQSLIMDVQGVGYAILISLNTYQQLPELGAQTQLQIHMHVREDEMTLFGFSELTEKHLFLKLLRVNGVGPRLALNILSGISVAELLHAVHHQDLTRLTAIPGVGKKTAERLLFDLKDKLEDFAISGSAHAPLQDEILSVLLNLGFKRAQAEQALKQLNFPLGTPLAEAVRQTLQFLGKKS